jgi:hypothetical protein
MQAVEFMFLDYQDLTIYLGIEWNIKKDENKQGNKIIHTIF